MADIICRGATDFFCCHCDFLCWYFYLFKIIALIITLHHSWHKQKFTIKIQKVEDERDKKNLQPWPHQADEFMKEKVPQGDPSGWWAWQEEPPAMTPSGWRVHEGEGPARRSLRLMSVTRRTSSHDPIRLMCSLRRRFRQPIWRYM